MTKLGILLLINFSFFQFVRNDVTRLQECGNFPISTERIHKITAQSRKERNGEWVDIFSAVTDSRNSSKDIVLDVTHRIMECGGKRIIHVQGVARDKSHSFEGSDILFHPKCGTNVAVTNGGRTVQKINLNEPLDSVVLTDRPLKDDEVFEVKLDKKHTKFSSSFGIGISTNSAADIDIPKQMYKIPGTWMMHHTNIYSNGKEIITHYGQNVNDLKVGDRLGVMKSRFGALHIFINGVDQGPAASNLPEQVFGVVELYYNAAKATILHTMPSIAFNTSDVSST